MLRRREATRRAQVSGEGVAVVNPAQGMDVAPGGGKTYSGLSLSTPKASFAGRSARASHFFMAGNGGGGEEDKQRGGGGGGTSIFSGGGGGGGGGANVEAEEETAARKTVRAGHGVLREETGGGEGAGPSGGEEALTETEMRMREAGLEDSYVPESMEQLEEDEAGMIDMSDIRRFITTPAPRDGSVVQCYVVRNKSGKKRMFPTYMLYEQSTDTFLLAARKRKKSKSSNYLVSLSAEDLSRDSVNYVGKLRSNFVGTAFTFYDHGEAPDKVKPGQDLRCELAGVMYESNILGFKGPRKMTVVIPRMEEPSGRPCVWQPDAQGRGLISEYKAGETQNMDVIVNRAPTWNNESQSYVLNFNRRVTHASVKNFQLIYEQDDENPREDGNDESPTLLQFGRVGDHKFTMDFAYPMTCLQAFGIVLSSFDNKLACE